MASFTRRTITSLYYRLDPDGLTHTRWFMRALVLSDELISVTKSKMKISTVNRCHSIGRWLGMECKQGVLKVYPGAFF